jgi:hypothetical protein
MPRPPIPPSKPTGYGTPPSTHTKNSLKQMDADSLVQSYHDRVLAASLALCDAVATTTARLAMQVRHALNTFGSVDLGGDWHNWDLDIDDVEAWMRG